MFSKNVIFIHAAKVYGNRYQEILNMFERYILESSLYKHVDKIFVEIQGTDETVTFNVPNAIITHNGLPLGEMEFPTLDKIIKYSAENAGDKILYLQTQGASYPASSLTEERREYLLHWNVTKFNNCLNELESNDVTGCMLLDKPVKHYHQNFWWANCRHINTLTNPRYHEIVIDWRHNAEFWICSKQNGKYSTLHNLYSDWQSAMNFNKSLWAEPE